MSTQAPTPGPLSGDEYRCPDCGAQADERFDCCKAPTAPVEASGSEREIVFGQFQPFSDFPDLAAHIGRMGATGQLGSVTEWDTFLATLNAAVSNKEGHIPPINAATVIAYEDAHAVAVEMGYPSLTEALEHLSELRPQPSGETREAMKEALAELKRIPAPLTDDGDVTSWDSRNEVAAGIHAAETWLERALALRPQPSGETREAVARLTEWRDRMKNDEGRAAHFGSPYADKPMANGRTYWNRDLAADLATILALRPAPVTSGGEGDA